MQPLPRKLMLVIASLLVPVLLAEVGIADPSVSKTHINKTVAVVNIVQQTGSEGSRRRAQLNRLSEPQAIAVDDVGGKIYWTDSGTHKIHRANLNGSGCETLVKWSYNPRGIAVDRIDGKFYWADSLTHQISRANLDGSRLEILVALPKKAGN